MRNSAQVPRAAFCLAPASIHSAWRDAFSDSTFSAIVTLGWMIEMRRIPLAAGGRLNLGKRGATLTVPLAQNVTLTTGVGRSVLTQRIGGGMSYTTRSGPLGTRTRLN